MPMVFAMCYVPLWTLPQGTQPRAVATEKGLFCGVGWSVVRSPTLSAKLVFMIKNQSIG